MPHADWYKDDCEFVKSENGKCKVDKSGNDLRVRMCVSDGSTNCIVRPGKRSQDHRTRNAPVKTAAAEAAVMATNEPGTRALAPEELPPPLLLPLPLLLL